MPSNVAVPAPAAFPGFHGTCFKGRRRESGEDSGPSEKAVAEVRFGARDLMVPSIGRAPFDRAGWIFELKYDGFRAVLGKRGEQLRMLSRKDHDMLAYFPEIRACLETLPDMVIDGELVVLDDQGRAQFEPLRRRLVTPQSEERRARRVE